MFFIAFVGIDFAAFDHICERKRLLAHPSKECIHDKFRFGVVGTCGSELHENTFAIETHLINIWTDIYGLFTALCFLGHDDLFLGKKSVQFLSPGCSRFFSITKLYKIVCCCYQGHGGACFAVFYLTGRTYGNTVCHDSIQSFLDFLCRNSVCQFHIKIFSETGSSYTEWCCKGHDHMWAVST